jgi:predicted nucleotidyltransferase
MNLSRPSTAVCSPLEADVLRVLSGSTVGMTGRHIASLTGRSSHSGVLETLNRLTEHGLVRRTELNRAYLFSLNREHLAAPAVSTLVGIRETMTAELRREIGLWPLAPVHASLFGSAARGDGDTQSDIDLFLVRPSATDSEDPAWRAQIDALTTKLEGWTGNRASVHELSEVEITRLRRELPPIAQALRSDAVTLAGCDISDLLG